MKKKIFAFNNKTNVLIFGEYTNFESNLGWDPHVFFSGFKLHCVLFHEEMKNKHLFAQIHRDLNETMTSKVGTINIDNG